MSLSSLESILDRVEAGSRGGLRTPINKSLTDYAELAVGPVYRHTVAEWILDRNMFVRQYRNSVAIGVGAIARKMAMQEVKILRRYFKKSGIKVEPADQTLPICEFFRNINPIMTEFDLWYYTEGWKLLTGNAYWWFGRNLFRQPTEIWVIPSQWVRAIPSRTQYIGAYEIRNLFRTEHPVILPGTEINQLDEPNLDQNANGRFYGQPVIIPAANAIDIENNMFDRLRWKQNNFAEPGQIFTTDKVLTETQLRQVYNQIVNQHTLTEQTGRPMITHSGLKPQIPHSARREIDFKDSFDVTMTLILAIIGVPKAVVGLVVDSNRANSDAAMLTFCENCINPRLKHNGQHLTKTVCKEFEPDGSLMCYFEPCAPQDAEQLRKDVETGAKTASLDPNEIREKLFKMGPFKRGGNRPTLPSAAVLAQWGNDNDDGTEPGLEPPIKTSVPNAGIPGQEGQQSEEGLFSSRSRGASPQVKPGAGDGLFSGNGDTPNPHANGNGSLNGNGRGMFRKRPGLFKSDRRSISHFIREWEKFHTRHQQPFTKGVFEALQKTKYEAIKRFSLYAGISKSAVPAAKGLFGTVRLQKAVSPDAVMTLVPIGKSETLLAEACDGAMFEAAIAGARLELSHVESLHKSATADLPEFVRSMVTLPAAMVANIRKELSEAFDQDYWRRNVTDTTRDLLRDILLKSVTEGWTAQETQGYIEHDTEHIFDAIRARRIATTETTGAINGGQHAAQIGMINEGLIEGIEWLGILDNRIREDHRETAGQQVVKEGGYWMIKKGDTKIADGREFVVGDERARYPGDPQLSAKERVHCRCLTRSIVL